MQQPGRDQFLRRDPRQRGAARGHRPCTMIRTCRCPPARTGRCASSPPTSAGCTGGRPRSSAPERPSASRSTPRRTASIRLARLSGRPGSPRARAGSSPPITAAGDEPVWAFGRLAPASFWARRQSHETMVHRADAELAVGRDVVLDAGLAADGIDEWLASVTDPRYRQPGDGSGALPFGAVLAVQATGAGPGRRMADQQHCGGPAGAARRWQSARRWWSARCWGRRRERVGSGRPAAACAGAQAAGRRSGHHGDRRRRAAHWLARGYAVLIMADLSPTGGPDGGLVATAAATCDQIEAVDADLHAFMPEQGRRARLTAQARASSRPAGRPRRAVRRCTASRSASRMSSASTACRRPPAQRCNPRCSAGAEADAVRRLQGGRRADRGQDRHGRVRHVRAGPDRQSARPRAHARRLKQRLGCGRRRRPGAARARHADDRVGDQAGRVLRRARLPADSRAHTRPMASSRSRRAWMSSAASRRKWRAGTRRRRALRRAGGRRPNLGAARPRHPGRSLSGAREPRGPGGFRRAGRSAGGGRIRRARGAGAWRHGRGGAAAGRHLAL